MTQYPFVVALTGGIGSGKTAASDWFFAQGIHIVDADIAARKVVELGQPAHAAIRQHFGPDVFLPTGELDRAAMRQRIFTEPAARLQLEQLTHPAIRQWIHEQLATSQSPYTLFVSPLLLQSPLQPWIKRVLLIDSPEHLQTERASQRDGKSSEHIAAIMAAQQSRAERISRADDIVLNDGNLQHLYQQLKPLHAFYLGLTATFKADYPAV